MGTTVRNAKAIQSAALFSELCRKKNFSNLLVDGAPTKMDGRSSNQTSYAAPIVRVTDLSKGISDEVVVDLFHRLNGRPTMGDKKLAGRGETLTQSEMSLKINQGRHSVDAGGRMAQHRTNKNLEAVARSVLGPYVPELNDELMTYHLCGARGNIVTADTKVPLENDPEFAEILVNPLMPPTYDRHMFGGNATSLETLDSADIFTLDAVESLRLVLDEMVSMRVPEIRFKEDGMAEDSPMYVLWVTPRQLFDFKQTTSFKDMQTMVSNATARSSGFNHPLFKGDRWMWENILIKRLPRYHVQFGAGDTVKVSTNTNNAGTTQVTAGTTIHRAILMGGQALAHAFGNQGKMGGEDAGFIGMHTEKTDHENSSETSIRWMSGMKKIRFADKFGRVNDNGIITLDTAVSAASGTVR